MSDDFKTGSPASRQRAPAEVDLLARSRQNYAEGHAWLGWIIDAAKATDAAITEIKLPSNQAHTGTVIAMTGMVHAMSLLRILPKPGVGEELYDVSSCAALTRSMADGYIAFRYHAVEPQTEQDRQFRERLAEHHLQAKQKRLVQGMAATDPRRIRISAAADAACLALEKDPLFLDLPAGKRDYLLAAKASMHVEGSTVAETAGLDGAAWSSLYANLSQYAHSSPLAVARLAAFNASEPAAGFEMGLMASVSAMLLARMLGDLVTLVPGSNKLWSEKQVTMVPGMAASLAELGPGLWTEKKTPM